MIALRLVRMIESHSDQLAHGLREKVLASDKLAEFRSKVPAVELEDRAFEIYRNIGDWLSQRSEKEIETRYMEVGARRAAQGVPFSQFLCAMTLTRDHLWEFIMLHGLVDRAMELYQELELRQQLDAFFDRANYYAAVGYENYLAAQRKPAAIAAGSTVLK
jgi:hypothetical protein